MSPTSLVVGQKEKLTNDDGLSAHNSPTLSKVSDTPEIDTGENNSIDESFVTIGLPTHFEKDKEFFQYIENEIISDLTQDRPADPQSLPSYALVLTSSVPWLKSYSISGEQLVADVFSGIKELMELRADIREDMEESALQRICIYRITRCVNAALLNAFYESANIRVIDLEKLSTSVKSINEDTYAIYVYETSQSKPFRFFVTATEYKDRNEQTIKRCLTQAATMIKVRKAKNFLLNHLPKSEIANLAHQQSFEQEDLLNLIRKKYEIVVEVPRYMVLHLLEKNNLVYSHNGINIRQK